MLECVICGCLNCSHLDLPDEMFEDMLCARSKVMNALFPPVEFVEKSFGEITKEMIEIYESIMLPVVQVDWSKILVGVPLLDLDLSEDEIDEYLKGLLSSAWDDEPTRPGVSTGPTSLPVSEPIEVIRKRDGLCIHCGDRGEFVAGACMCKNGHGKIFG